MTAQPVFQNLTIIGAGLIGSSIARAARTYGAAAHITICDRDLEACKTSSRLEIADAVTTNVAVATSDADCVIVCVPVGAIEAVVQEMSAHLKAGAIISDVGSVKASVAEAFGQLPSSVHAIPAHPVAGTEKSGPESGFAALFQKRWCILTPPDGVAEGALARLIAFWEALGAMVEIMSPEHHDRVLAITSHLPHLIAYNIVGTVSDLEDETKSEVIKFSAGGFRDFTRIAASDPTMWRDVFLNNREAVLEMLGRFSEDLTALQRAIRKGNGDALYDLFERTRDIRRNIIDAGQETAAPDFGRSDHDGSVEP
jgi:cyclohexadieny/prephenate dehydrogenase